MPAKAVQRRPAGEVFLQAADIRLGGHQGSTSSGLAAVDSMCLRRASITGAEVQSTPLGCYPSAGLRQVATTGTFLEWP